MTSVTIQLGGEAFIYEAIRTPRGKGKKDGSLSMRSVRFHCSSGLSTKSVTVFPV